MAQERKGLGLLVGVTLFWSVSGGAAGQTNFYVNAQCGDDSWTGSRQDCVAPAGPKATIQAGIDSAQGGDTVILADGVYRDRGNTDFNFLGKAITLRSANGSSACRIFGDLYHVGARFDHGEGPDSVVEGILFTLPDADVAAITIENGSHPTIRGCTFENCFVVSLVGGGAVRVAGHSGATITECRFADNESWGFSGNDGGGGAINCSESDITISDCVFASNRADVNGLGGALYIGTNSVATIRNCQFIENHGPASGGAAFIELNSTVEFEDCVFRGNVAFGELGVRTGGGAVSVQYESRGTFVRCEFYGNEARDGAALRNETSTMIALDCLFAYNTAERRGCGGVTTESGTTRLHNCTFVGNYADGTDSIGAIATLGTGEVVASNCVVWDNSMPPIDGNVSVEYSCAEGGWPGEGNITDDPQFIDAGNGNYRLGPTSPCIDAGDSALLICEREASLDLDLLPRFQDVLSVADRGRGTGAIVDMGSYEAAGRIGLRVACVSPVQAGVENEVVLAQGFPGRQIYVVYGFRQGSTRVPGCPSAELLIDNPVFLARVIADSTGEARFSGLVPRWARGHTVGIQAMEPSTCRVSNAAILTFPN